MRLPNLSHKSLLVVLACAAWAIGWTGPLPSLPIGMNIQGASYWDRVPYLDPLLASSGWISYHTGGSWDDQTADSIHLLPSGWPERIPQNVGGVPTRIRTMVNNCRSGDYVLSYQGKGRLSWNGGATARQSGNQTVVHLDGTCGHAWMQLDSSDAMDPVHDMHLVAIEFAGHPEQAPLFDPDFLRGLRPFHALRFMDWTATNGSRQMHWNDRPKPSDRTFGDGRGMPWEHAIALANQLSTDAWICTPHAADDDYLQHLAVLFRDSLRAELKTYLEYSNEVWNWGFDQAHWVGHNGANIPWGTSQEDLVAATDVRDSLKEVGRLVCGDPTDYCHPEKDAYMMGRLFRLWEPLWAGQRSRLVTVATGQHAWTDNSRRILSWLVNHMKVVPDAYSVAGYMGFETGASDAIPKTVLPRTTDSLLASYYHNLWMLRPDTVKGADVVAAMADIYPYTSKLWTLETVRIAKSFGIKKYLVYEGGQHSQPHNQGDWPYNQAVWDAQIDPAMYDLYLRNLQVHDSLDCDLYAAFSYVGQRESRYGSWGHLENYAQSALSGNPLREAAPKYAALLDANAPKSNTGLGPSRPTKNHSAAPFLSTSLGGRLPGIDGNILVLTLSGRLLYQGAAPLAKNLPEGALIVRPFHNP